MNACETVYSEDLIMFICEPNQKVLTEFELDLYQAFKGTLEVCHLDGVEIKKADLQIRLPDPRLEINVTCPTHHYVQKPHCFFWRIWLSGIGKLCHLFL